MGRPPLSAEQYERYRRHLQLPEFGLSGQQALQAARVLLIGVGGLGCPTAQYLAAAGVGQLGLLDPDAVDASNLQRQVLYGSADLGRPKVEVASERVSALNPEVDVRTHPLLLQASNARELLADYDVVVDGSDNFATRYLVNDACALLGKPLMYASVYRFEGQASVFDPRRGPCYRCLYPEPPPPGSVPSCAEGGVLGVLPGLLALIQATETLKQIAGIGDSLLGRLLQVDALRMEFREFRLAKDPKCPLCGDAPGIRDLQDYPALCGAPQAPGLPEISASQLQALRASGEGHLLLDVREADEVATARIEGSLTIPLDELEARLDELAPYKTTRVIVHCHHGGRSARAARWLRERGFEAVENLAGGIEAWSLTVDPSVARYE